MLDACAFEQILEKYTTGITSLAVAVSGGSDSMALALLVHEWAQKHRITIVALTVDHGLRQTSQEEAQRVHQWMNNYSIEHRILTWQGPRPTNNIQANARSMRYQLMQDYCHTHHIPLLLTGHTCDDQAETFLLRLARESGVYGLSSMAEVTTLPTISLIRPLLDYKRSALQQYLTQRQQEWVDDPSNNNADFERVALRQWLAKHPETDRYTTHIAHSVIHLQRTRNYIEQMVEQFCHQAVTLSECGYGLLDRTLFVQQHEEIQLRSLSYLIMRVSGEKYSPRFQKLNTLRSMLLDPNFTAATLHGCHFFKNQKANQAHQIYMIREHEAILEKPLNISPVTVWDQRFRITPPQPLSCPIEVQKIKPDDLPCLKKHLKTTHQEMHHRILLTLPALYTLEKLIAVPHIGYYTDEYDTEINVTLIKK